MAVIRPARAEDAGAIAAIWNKVIRDTTITFTTVEKTKDAIASDIAARQAAGWGYLVADQDGVVIGLACYAPFRGGPGYLKTMEHTIYLSDDRQGQGLGRDLLLALQEHARSAGVRSLVAGIGAENQGSIRFHERMGFATVGRIKDGGTKFDRFIDLVLMQKTL